MINRRLFLRKSMVGGILSVSPLSWSAWCSPVVQQQKKEKIVIGGKVVNKLMDNHTVLNLWGKRSKEVNNLYDCVHGLFKENPTYTYVNIAKKEKVQALCKAAKQTLFAGPMLGDITSDRVSVWLRTLASAAVTIKLWDADGKERLYGPVYSSEKTEFTAILKLTDLDAGRDYFYEVYVNDQKIVLEDVDCLFHTPVKDNTLIKGRIIFGSCYHRWGLGNMKQSSCILDRKPDAMLLLGDIAVQDRMNNAALHRDDYFLRDLIPAWRKMVASVPVYATWDDHDYMNNDLAGIPKGMTKQDKENIWQVYRNVWNNPYYGFGEKEKGVFLHTTIGPADVIMVDNRYFREKKKGSFLGDDQMEWLKKTLLACKSPFKILSCGSMWADYVSDGKDSWGVNDPQGREDLFHLIQKNNIKGVLLISGDRHGARGFAIPLSDDFNLYEFGGASLGARSGPPVSKPEWTTQMYGIANLFAFSEFTFSGTAKNPLVTFQLIADDGAILFKRQFTQQELTPATYK